MKTILFVTGNKYKFLVAQNAFAGLGIKLVQKKLETPEIQSTEVENVASFSAEWASNKLQKAVLVSDAGYYIKSLNGFPGPFIKYSNQWLRATDYLNLMRGKKNRKVIVKDCLAYCEPGKPPKIFCGFVQGKIAKKVGKKGLTSINEIFIPNGFNKVESEIPWKEMKEFWGKNMGHWNELGNYFTKKKSN